MLRLLPLLLLVLGLTGCASRQTLPLSEAERADINECKQDATDMSDAPYSSANPHWATRFERCMRERGYTNAQIHALWY